MLVSLLNLLFNLLIFLTKVAYWIMLAYVIMSMVIPQNKYVQLAGKYVEPVLSPIRAWLDKTFPKLSQTRLDFSPVVVWLLLVVVSWLLSLLKTILL